MVACFQAFRSSGQTQRDEEKTTRGGVGVRAKERP